MRFPSPADIAFLHIEITTRCNFKCAFCCGRKMKQSDIDLSTFKKAIAIAPKLTNLLMQGEGEPLLHPQFFIMLAYAKEKELEISMTTNGSLLSLSNRKQLIDSKIDHVNVSIETTNSQTFSEIRGGNLNTIINNTQLLAQESDFKTNVGFAVTVLKKFLSEIPAIFSLYKRLNLTGGIHFQTLQRMDSYRTNYSQEVSSQIFTFNEEYNLQKHLHYKGFLKDTNRSSSFNQKTMKGFRIGKRSCPFLEKSLFVNANGEISPCCRIKNFSWGSIDQVKQTDIQSLRIKMISQMRSGITPASCTGCYIAQLAMLSISKRVVLYIKMLWNVFIYRKINGQ